jgi:hypothetical protein
MKRIVNAKEFLASFRARPDDLHLLKKYGMSLKQLRQVYAALIEKGLLSEFEYNHRERKAPELEECAPPQLSMSTAVSLVETPSEALTEHILKLGYSLDPDLAEAVTSAIEGKNRRIRKTTQSE